MSPTVLKTIYAGTDAGSPLRRLAVDECAWDMGPNFFKDHASEFPPEMLIDMVIAFKDASPEHLCGRKKKEITQERDYSVPEDE